MRSPFEFAAPVSNGEIKMIERVQHQATKIPHDLKGFRYEDRLEKLGLTTLEERRIRGDCLQMYKIEKGKEIVDWHFGPIPGPTSDRPVRVRSRRLQKEMVKNCEQRSQFFSNRVVDKWNKLPEEVVKAESVNAFKATNGDVYKKRIV